MHFDDEDDKKAIKKPKFPIQMYVSEGNKYFRLGKYELAIEFFNKGLEKEPGNEKCLIGRSKCYMRLAKYAEAKEDAKTVLKTRPKSCDAKMLIGEADYFLGDFEKAFLTFYRGHSSRINHDGLRCGHQMCRKAIDNSLNPDVPIILDEEDVKNIRKLGKDQEIDQTNESNDNQCGFSADINFVNSLLEDDSISSVHQECEYVRDYLRDRQTFWKTQNPITSINDEFYSLSEDTMEKIRDFAYGFESSSSESCSESSEESEGDENIPETNSDHDESSSSESNSNPSMKNSIDTTEKSIVEEAEDYIPVPDTHQEDEEISSRALNPDTSEKSHGTDSTAENTEEKAENSAAVLDSHETGETLSNEFNSEINSIQIRIKRN